MNELIQELADRAIGGMPRDWIQTHDWNIPDEFLEKFAELIVKECARVSERTGSLNEADYEGEMISDAIKEHFGVEE